MLPTSRILPIAFSIVTFFGCAGPAASQEDEIPVEPTGASANALAADITVYGDSLITKPWANWGWSSDVNLADATSPRLPGSGTQIKTTLKSPWGALSLARTEGDFATSNYDSIAFDVRSDATDRVYFFVEPLAGSAAPIKLPVPVTSSWSRQTIPLDRVKGDLSSFGKINIMAERAGDSFYVDNVQLVARGISTTIPSAPITPAYEQVSTQYGAQSPYHLYVPRSYDGTHRTPTRLLVWLHGCGGEGYGDTWSVSPGGSQSWISLSLGGRDGQCWDVDNDASLVLSALQDVKKRLNVDPRKVVIGGYSSGGDLAYRTAFYNAREFAGVIAENTSPFRDTGSGPDASIGAAAWRFNVAHLAHLQDYTYPIGGVREETDRMKAAGFPIERIERNGGHWDNDSGSYGTMQDRRTYLLPYLDRGWLAPAR